MCSTLILTFVYISDFSSLFCVSLSFIDIVPLSIGPPSSIFARFTNNRFFRFLYLNHQGHHVLGGTCNFNVCCPGADHLFGTYVEESVWRRKMKAVTDERETNKDKNNVYSDFVYETISASDN